MRLLLALASAALLASPVAAQAPAEPIQIPPELTDPAMMARIGDMVGALSRALMNMPIGEVEAAVAGPPRDPRRPQPHRPRRRRWRRPQFRGEPPAPDRRQPGDDAGGHEGDGRGNAGDQPGGEPRRQSEIERATANLPSPTYPRR